MRRGRLLLGGLVATLLLSATACGDDGDQPAADRTDETSTSPSAEASTSSSDEASTSQTDRPTTTGTPDGDEPTTVTSYVADFTVDEGGDLAVVENLTVDFPVADLHGIYRFFDREALGGGEQVVEDFAATADGATVPVEHTVEHTADGAADVYRVGDPEVTLPIGEHVYEISYAYPAVLASGDLVDASHQFHWALVPGGWEQDIEATDLTVHLPAPAEEVECAVGEGKASYPCPSVELEGERTVRIATGPLPSHTPVTLLVGQDLD